MTMRSIVLAATALLPALTLGIDTNPENQIWFWASPSCNSETLKAIYTLVETDKTFNECQDKFKDECPNQEGICKSCAQMNKPVNITVDKIWGVSWPANYNAIRPDGLAMSMVFLPNVPDPTVGAVGGSKPRGLEGEYGWLYDNLLHASNGEDEAPTTDPIEHKHICFSNKPAALLKDDDGWQGQFAWTYHEYLQ